MQATPADRAALERRLADAKQHRDCYAAQAREVRDMAAERVTPQGRDATMAHAMRLKAQELVWEREVCALTAQLAAKPVEQRVELAREQIEGADDMAGVL